MSRPARVAVTGASRGIGHAIARRLLSQGRSVLLVARSAEPLARLASEHAPLATTLVADLIADPGALGRAIGDGAELDGLVHAAGVAPHAPLEAVTDDALERAWRLHVVSPLKSAQALAADLRRRGSPGAMVFVSSTLGIRPAATMLAYSATKAALLSMTRTMALELAADGVRVNAVAPGVVDTAMARELRLAPGEAAPTDAAERTERIAAQLEGLRRLHPLGRLGTAEEVADAALYLLDAPWTTGSVLTVDGGLNAG